MAVCKLLTVFLLIGVVVSLPARFVNDDCTNFECMTDNFQPLCGSDEVTYDSPCELQMANKKRLCWMGHYNLIMKMHDGPCHTTSTSTTTTMPTTTVM